MVLSARVIDMICDDSFAGSGDFGVADGNADFCMVWVGDFSNVLHGEKGRIPL